MVVCSVVAREMRIEPASDYEHRDEPASAIVSVAALHHLPDFWKAVALKRMAAMLRPGGRLYLLDVVYTFDVASHAEALNGIVTTFEAAAGPVMTKETVIHIRDEYSTFDWVLDGMLDRTGFRIDEKQPSPPLLLGYTCTRL